MKLTNVKALATKAMVAAVAAGALLFAAPTKSQAQVVVGFTFGHPAPVYVAPRPIYVAPRPYIVRRDEWIRAHRFERPWGYR